MTPYQNIELNINIYLILSQINKHYILEIISKAFYTQTFKRD